MLATRLFLIVSAIVLSGCAGISYATKKYEGAFFSEFKSTDGSVYRIFDQPEYNRLMIGLSASQSASQGFIRGLGAGSGIGSTSPVVLRDAAEEFLKSTGRRCESRDITLIVDSQYEVRYKCAGSVRKRSRVGLS